MLFRSDILLYDTHYVPVGNDQKQHIELARDIAIRFNNRFGDTFVIPEPMIAKVEDGARIMSLDDPLQKMSKSNPNEHSKITLLDSPALVKKSIMRATTDSESIIKYDLVNKPGVSNLLTMYAQLTSYSISELEAKYEGQGYGTLKKDLVEVVNEELLKVQTEFNRILASGEVYDVLKTGREKASTIANEVLDRVKKTIGFVTY